MRCIVEHCENDAQEPRSVGGKVIHDIEQVVHVCDEHLDLFDEWRRGAGTRSWRLTKDEEGRLLSLFAGDEPYPSSRFPTRTLIGLLRRHDTRSFVEVAEMQNSAGAWVPVSPIVLRDTGAPITIEPGDVIDFSGEPAEIKPTFTVVN